MRPSPTLYRRWAMTTVEVLVVLVVLGLIGGLVAVQVPWRRAEEGTSTRVVRLSAARMQALRQGRVIVIADSSEENRLWWAAAFPDGSVVADSSPQLPSHLDRTR